VDAYERHLALFLRATAGVVDRQVLEVPYRSAMVTVPVHCYRTADPVATLVFTGGVDTWKTELHRLASTLSRRGRVDVVAFDMPGTGESTVALAGDAEEIYRGVVDRVRADMPIGVMGISFGGHWAAKLALEGGVDFSVDLGGPVGAAEPPEAALELEGVDDMPNGMSGILAHALRLPAMPTLRDAVRLLPQFSLYHALAGAEGHLAAPLLVINGADDVYIPPADVEVFRPFDAATVWLVENAGHCAFERFRDVRERIVTWLHEAARQHPLASS
jgi:esterase FrsA